MCEEIGPKPLLILEDQHRESPHQGSSIETNKENSVDREHAAQKLATDADGSYGETANVEQEPTVPETQPRKAALFGKRARISEQVSHKIINNANTLATDIYKLNHPNTKIPTSINAASGAIGVLTFAASLANVGENAAKLNKAKAAEQKLRTFTDNQDNSNDVSRIADDVAKHEGKRAAQIDMGKSVINMAKSGLITCKSSLQFAGKVCSGLGKAIPFVGAAAGICSAANIGTSIQTDKTKNAALNSAAMSGPVNKTVNVEDPVTAANALKEAAVTLRKTRNRRNWFGFSMEGLSAVLGITLGILACVGTGGLAVPILAGCALVVGCASAGENIYRLRKQTAIDGEIKRSLETVLKNNRLEITKDNTVSQGVSSLNCLLDASLKSANQTDPAREFLLNAARLGADSKDELQKNTVGRLFELASPPQPSPEARKELLMILAKRIL